MASHYPRRVGVVTGVNFDELAAAFGTDRDSAGVIGLDMAAVASSTPLTVFVPSRTISMPPT